MISLMETPKQDTTNKESIKIDASDKSVDEEMKDITDQVQKTSTESSDQAEQATSKTTSPLLPKLVSQSLSSKFHHYMAMI